MKLLFTLFGLAVCVFAMFLLLAGNSYFADFSSERMVGFGVDIFLYDKFPAKDGVLPIEVSARGGTRIGINSVTIVSGQKIVAQKGGEGKTWGHVVSGSSRDNEEMYFDLPVNEISNGDEIYFQVYVNAVAAMGSGLHSFENKTMDNYISVNTRIYSPGERIFGRLKFLLFAIFNLAIWYGVNFYVMKWYKKYIEKDEAYEKDKGLEIVMVLFGGSMLGYFVFTRVLAGAFGITSTVFTVFTMLLWIGIAVWALVKSDKKTMETEEPKKPLTPEELAAAIKFYTETMERWKKEDENKGKTS